MIFKTRVDLFYKLVVVFVFLLFSFVLFNIDFKKNSFGFYFILIIQITIIFFFIASALTTKFIISDTELICKTFYWKKKIPFNLIRKVEKQSGLYAGWKINTAYKSLIVYYNKYDELLISPENELAFIEELTKRLEEFK